MRIAPEGKQSRHPNAATRTAGAPIGCQRPSRFWGLGCPKIGSSPD
ncbi:hypothetical protein [Thiolapillus sp.]|nr:hypothetical protein [Thiolapillus sp.]